MMAKKEAKGGLSVKLYTRGQIEVEWEIRNFLDQPHKNGEYLRSPHFLLGDAAWCVDIFPKGDSVELSDDWVSLFLRRVSSFGIHAVSFSIRIKAGGSNIYFGNHDRNFNATKEKWGWKKFMQRSTISAYLRHASSDGAVTVVCTAQLLDERHGEATAHTSQLESQYKEAATQTSELEGQNKEATSATSRTEGLQAFSKQFEELFLGGNWTDIKIKVGEREFDVHKVVLRVRSPVFAAMFDHEMAENSSGVIDIPDMDPDYFQDFLLFMYTGQFNHVTSSNAVCLYKAADKYAVEKLKEECNRRMVSDLSVESVLDVIPLAVTYGEDEILKIASEFFLENAEEIINTENWEFFLEQNIPIANDLLIKMAKSLIAQRKVLELRN